MKYTENGETDINAQTWSISMNVSWPQDLSYATEESARFNGIV